METVDRTAKAWSIQCQLKSKIECFLPDTHREFHKWPGHPSEFLVLVPWNSKGDPFWRALQYQWPLKQAFFGNLSQLEVLSALLWVVPNSFCSPCCSLFMCKSTVWKLKLPHWFHRANSFAEEAGLVYRFIRRNKVRTMSLIPFSRLSAVRVLIVNYLVVHIDSQLLVSFTTSFCREIDLDWSD